MRPTNYPTFQEWLKTTFEGILHWEEVGRLFASWKPGPKRIDYKRGRQTARCFILTEESSEVLRDKNSMRRMITFLDGLRHGTDGFQTDFKNPSAAASQSRLHHSSRSPFTTEVFFPPEVQ